MQKIIFFLLVFTAAIVALQLPTQAFFTVKIVAQSSEQCFENPGDIICPP
ncbi:MAG: hypothetical protein LRZ84_13815 [Desertifilum sp.]|nr:hypothetical protein [Desertifilum sp.]MDI9638634.1 hypothetical protein [Geitlerinema splendidum]